MAGGRPTDYKLEYCEQVVKLCKLGATDKELADFFDVEESTINNWKLAHPEFLESLRAGKMYADANVAEKLYQRAIGYVGKTTKFATFEGSITDSKEVEEHYPPDTTAAIFWLKNRQSKKWRDKTENGFTDGDGNDIIPVQFYLPDNGRSKNNPATKGVSGEGT
jgi:hypothetical protein